MSLTREPVVASLALRLADLASAIGGALDGPADAAASSYAIDSRAVAAGTVFFALAGDRTDGHRFLEDVHGRGALAAVVKRDAAVPGGLAAIRVDNPALALADLGRHFRDLAPLEVVGITGSAGKTTTKEFTAGLLATRREVFKSEGNLNTTIGLPLTLCRRRPEQTVAVLELGMSYPGELRRVAAIARPHVAVITNIGLAHALNFDSADDVARAKAEILEEVRDGGTFVANADDPRVMALAGSFSGKVLTFGLGAADVRADDVTSRGADGTDFGVVTSDGRAEAHLAVVGEHQVANALAALAVARALGLDPLELAPAVASLGATDHRGALVRLGGDVTLLDDCYNANPAATLAALDTLATLPGSRKVAVIGDMLELGQYAEASHREVGERAAARADIVIAVGAESEWSAEAARDAGLAAAHHVADADAAAAKVLELLQDGDAILVKGSRGIGLEAVVTAVSAQRPNRTEQEEHGA